MGPESLATRSMFSGLRVPAQAHVRLNPREHTAQQWLSGAKPQIPVFHRRDAEAIQCCPIPGGSRMDLLRVCTYNIHKGDQFRPAWRKSTTWVAVEQLDTDIVCLRRCASCTVVNSTTSPVGPTSRR